MPTPEVIAERLVARYWQLMARDTVPDARLDGLLYIVAEMDTAGGGLESRAVREMLDGRALPTVGNGRNFN